MGILDDVVINAKTAAEAVGKKAGQIVDVSKLRFNVAELNAEISKRYEALGEYVYENCREALAEDAESVGKMAEIDELVNQRNILTKELVDKQNKVVCPSCGKQSPITASYCSSCGAKLPKEGGIITRYTKGRPLGDRLFPFSSFSSFQLFSAAGAAWACRRWNSSRFRRSLRRTTKKATSPAASAATASRGIIHRNTLATIFISSSSLQLFVLGDEKLRRVEVQLLV
ncbi:MAG: hypothetical protein ACLRSY_04660 [Acutalibacter sp.]